MNQIDRAEAFEKAERLARKTWSAVSELSFRAAGRAKQLANKTGPALGQIVGKTSALLDTKLSGGPAAATAHASADVPLTVRPEFELPPLEKLRLEITEFTDAISSVVVGQERTVRLALCCFIAGGHLLLDGPPGLGKTTLAQALAAVTGRLMRRIQFTSDLMPGDLLGVPIFDQTANEFIFRKGPVFSEIVLADEINRAPPRAQSALLEAMAEGQVSMDGETHALPKGFFVVATQNPLGQIGAFPLPESQLDRFLMRLHFTHPGRVDERDLMRRGDRREAARTLSKIHGLNLRSLETEIEAVTVGERVISYIQDLVEISRDTSRFRAGLSVRASLALMTAARSWAWMHGRDWVEPDDVQSVFSAVAEHRLLGRDAAGGSPTGLSTEILATTPLT